MRCLKCGSENREGRRFCGSCGSKLGTICPKCGAANEPDESFCGDCGATLGAESRQAAKLPTDEALAVKEVAPVPVDGERKTVTALFADIKGSTELMRELDPEEARAIVDPVLQLMMAAVHRYDGYVAQSTGDGIFAMFGAPVAHEDHAQRALHAALAIRDELHSYAEQTKAAGRPTIEARIGINTGEVVLRMVNTGTHTEYSPVGHAANLAARLQAVAPAGGVIVSDDTRKLVEDYFELRHLGPAALRGITEPVNVYEVMSAGPLRGHFDVAARRGLTKFVGREHELEQMRRALDQAMDGHGQLVAIVAEAGAGKSRLVHEFKALLPSECKLLEAHSVSYGKASAWLPVLELLRGYFGIDSADDPATKREKVRTAQAALDLALNDTMPYLLWLLGIPETPDPLEQMDPKIRQRRTLNAIKQIIIRESVVQPTVVIFEDLHWIDGETQALLDLVADSIANTRVLLLVDYRPEYRHEWSGRTHYFQLRLDPLLGQNAAAMLSALLSNGAELDSLKRLIAERTSGNPFFMEEMVEALFEQGILARNGTVKLIRPLSQAHLPVTVQGVLAARVDRPQAADRDLLCTLAVVGHEFPLRLVQRIATTPADELEQRLSRLQAGEFVYEQPAANEIEYVFKHALTQEVAYNSLLIERRKALHERTAQALESLFVDRIDEHLLDLSYHYSRSGNDSRAIDYLGRVAQQAQQRSAYSQSVAYLEEALTRLNSQPSGPERDRKEIAIRWKLADAAMVMNGYAAPEYEHHVTRRYELAQRLGDTTQIFYSLVGMSVQAAFRLQLSRAQDVGWKLLGMADHEHDRDMQLEAHGSLANILWLIGDFAASREHAEKGRALFANTQIVPTGKEHMWAACQVFACLSTAALGFADQALEQARAFLTSARERGPQLALAIALNCMGTISLWRRDGAEALKYGDALLAVAYEHGFSTWYSFGQLVHGQALALLTKADEGIAEIKMAVDSLEGTGFVTPGWVYSCLAFAFLAAKQPAEGLKVTAKALEVAANTGDTGAKPELHRLHGELLLMGDSTKTPEGEAAFRAAVDVARNQSAKSSELRATTSLARLLARQGRRHEAHTMLGEIYNWFTEGFDIADLKEAKALLEELTA
jgi:class 3 adenylate cyclase/predicted ATPase